MPLGQPDYPLNSLSVDIIFEWPLVAWKLIENASYFRRSELELGQFLRRLIGEERAERLHHSDGGDGAGTHCLPQGEGRQGSVGQAGQVPPRGGDQEGKDMKAMFWKNHTTGNLYPIR